MPANLVNVHGTELLPSDTREQYRQKLARITLDSMVQFVGLLDANGTVLEINQVALDGVGIKLADVEGEPFWTTFWWQVSDEMNRGLKEAIQRASRGEFVRWDAEIFGRAGGKETIIIDASLMPVRDEHGQVVFITAEGRDITEKKAHEREIARQREELAALDKLKTQFFANISHEFRTPLTLMLGPIEDALGDRAEPLEVGQRERITMVQRNGLRLQKLVNALLDFSRVEAGRIQAVYQPTDLAALTRDLASSFRAACEKAGLTLTITAPPLPEPVFVDHEMWEKIVLNLVSNAFKFTLDGGIRVEMDAASGAAILRVSDTGTGITESELPRIFDRFHRVVGARGRTYEGTGIGLALVKELVELHKGAVSVESTVDKGTTFTVRVPFGSAHLPQDRLEAARTQPSTATRAEAFVSEALRWLPDGTPAEESRAHEPIASANGPIENRADVLIADDNADMREYLSRLLGGIYRVTAVADGEEALAAARRSRPDLILADVMMPRLDGFGLLQELRGDAALHSVPVIVLSARAGDEAKVEGLRMGADDYLVKPFSARELLARVAANVEQSRARAQSAQILQALEARVAERTAQLIAESEEREKAEGSFRLLVQGVVDYAIYMLDPTGVISSWNAGGERIKGYRSDEIIGQHFSRFFTEEDRLAGLPARALATAAGEGKYEAEGWRVRKDGTRFWASVVLDAIHDKDGLLIGFAKITRDITERREAMVALQRTQEQLAQAQKMEGIGHLTGGVAHDFNNLLTIIMGNLETLQRVTQEPGTDAGRLARLAENAMRGAQRAAALTQRLLAFSRQQPLDPKTLDLSRLVAGMSDLLRRSLGEHVAIETVLAGGLWRVHVDPNQLEVAILNLAVNARDAMPEGGKLTIETANSLLDESYAASQVEVLAGQYVVVSVSDTGRGMTREVMERAFEPFFTTKDVGHGTGLGLSQVYGFVKQSGGHVNIYSEVGQGTTVKIYLPRLHAAEDEVPDTEASVLPPSSSAAETILVVEDDEDVRTHAREILRELGYHTLEADTGRAALQLLEAHPEIQLLFTDVGLPGGMNGRRLAEEARRLRRDIKVLMTTGYARNAIVHEGRLDPGVQLITKPFTYSALAAKVRGILNSPVRSGRILLVEDEPLIRFSAVEDLESLGFRIETAGSATEAMSKLKIIGDLDAAIIDIGLPDRKGDVLVAEVRAIYPSMPIVIASGYGEDALRERFKSHDRIVVVSKPYATEQLRSALASLKVSGK